MTRVVITGVGAVSGYGVGVEALWNGLRSGASAVRRLPPEISAGGPLQIGAFVPEVLPEIPFAPAHRADHLAWLAAREALQSAGNPDVSRLGLAAAIGWGGWRDSDLFTPEQADAVAGRHPATGFDQLRRELAIDGPAVSCLSACAASLQSVGDAVDMIRSGRCDCCLAGGGDTRLSPLGIMGYVRLGAPTLKHVDAPEKACRPFDVDRAGFVMGEGAGFVLLENEEHARARGAAVLAEVAAVVANSDAFRLTDPEPDGAKAALCMEKCLSRAGVEARNIGCISLHGTGTPANDGAEAAALKRVLGDDYGVVPAVALKSMIGHLSMASGIVELIGMLDVLQSGVVPPTLNFDHLDPEAGNPGLCLSPRNIRVDTVMKNAFGFGGQNAVAVLKRCGI